jgi:L-threonylcarbamoyladenylate synthase
MRRLTPGGDLRARVSALADAASVIHGGGIVAIPTDTVYGLAADPFSEAAIARLFAVKGRADGHAVALVAADTAQVERQLGALTDTARRLASSYWPGPLTLLVDRPSSLPAALTGESPRVGVRVPNHDVTRELCRACGHMLTATSANMSGEPASDDPDVVARVFAASDVDLLLDAGRTPGGPPSTIVEVRHDGVRLVRPGAIAWEEVEACARNA